MSALPPTPVRRKPFGKFVKGCIAGQAHFLPDDFDRRLCLSVDRIDSLPKFQTWARERFPDWYMRRSGKDDGRTGHQHVASIWSHYLAWAEAA